MVWIGVYPVEVQTDEATHQRVPCALNGCYGYKPSYGLLPLLKYAPSNWPGMNTGVPAVCGPMGHSMRDMTLLTRVVRSAEPWLQDPLVMPTFFERGPTSRKPVVGVIYKSGVTPQPPIQRALQSAVAKLEAAGFIIKPFTPPDFADIREVTSQLFTVDGFSYAKGELAKAGEPPVPSVFGIGFFDREPKSHEEMWRWNARKIEYQKEMLDKWREAEIDIVLCPAAPHTAVKPGEMKNEMYTVVWNAVDVRCREPV